MRHQDDRPVRSKHLYLRLALGLCSMAICLLIGEITIRPLGSSDIDGNFTFRSRTLKPYHLPIRATREKIGRYLSSPSSAIVYDPVLGWAPRPHGSSLNGLYHYNSQGIRSAPSEYSLTPQRGVLRIAVFGDSFTHGDNVPFENTWGYYLEHALKANGVHAEVLNFGVGGYGIDQAYLRWKHLGYKFSPDVVILGFQAIDVLRNVNLMRPIFLYRFVTGIPFSKPRFILEGSGLKLINSPTPLPERVPEILEHFDEWNLVNYEYFYDREAYKSHVWFRSKLVTLLSDAISRIRGTPRLVGGQLYSVDEEPSQLALRIIGQFRSDVEAKGSHFLIVHLPAYNDLAALLRDKRLVYSKLLEKIEQDHGVIRPDRELLEQAKASSLDAVFAGRYSAKRDTILAGHYSAEGNKTVADVIAQSILGHEKSPRRRLGDH